MNIFLLLTGIALLLAALYFHAIAQANVITKIEREWFERLFTGNRASKDNLTEQGQHSRNRSNLCAIVGLIMIAIYLYLRSSSQLA